MAEQLKRHWILRPSPGFTDLKSLNFPQVPFRANVLWVVDDLDKFLGKSDIGKTESVLARQCRLKLIVTCRAGQELQQAKTDRELAAFLEHLPSVTCSDFSEQ